MNDNIKRLELMAKDGVTWFIDDFPFWGLGVLFVSGTVVSNGVRIYTSLAKRLSCSKANDL